MCSTSSTGQARVKNDTVNSIRTFCLSIIHRHFHFCWTGAPPGCVGESSDSARWWESLALSTPSMHIAHLNDPSFLDCLVRTAWPCTPITASSTRQLSSFLQYCPELGSVTAVGNFGDARRRLEIGATNRELQRIADYWPAPALWNAALKFLKYVHFKLYHV